MSFGKMGILINIVSSEITKDAEGFAVTNDNVLASMRAYREGRHGSQKWANRASFSEATDLFCFRTIPSINITTALSIICGEDRFDITSVEDVKGRGMYIEVLAKKVVPSSG